MLPKQAVTTSLRSWISLLTLAVACALLLTSACTFYGEHPARAFSDATGGEALERVFWKEVKASNWVEVERSLASNYASVTPAGNFDREGAIEHYRHWRLNDFSLGELKTEMNGNIIVVTYVMTLSGTTTEGASSQPLPSKPQHMMTVWQQEKKGWVAIAHSVSE